MPTIYSKKRPTSKIVGLKVPYPLSNGQLVSLKVALFEISGAYCFSWGFMRPIFLKSGVNAAQLGSLGACL